MLVVCLTLLSVASVPFCLQYLGQSVKVVLNASLRENFLAPPAGKKLVPPTETFRLHVRVKYNKIQSPDRNNVNYTHSFQFRQCSFVNQEGSNEGPSYTPVLW